MGKSSSSSIKVLNRFQADGLFRVQAGEWFRVRC